MQTELEAVKEREAELMAEVHSVASAAWQPVYHPHAVLKRRRTIGAVTSVLLLLYQLRHGLQ